MNSLRPRILLATAACVVMANPLAAIDLPRSTLRGVEQTCILNQRTTGSPFPCLAVDLTAGTAVLRAPFRQTHVVLIPTARITGVEDPILHRPGQPNYLQAAWTARSFVAAELKRPLDQSDLGLAINSTLTRSQDQLHIHVDCVDGVVRRRLAAQLAGYPTDRWLNDGFSFGGQRYAARRLEQPDLAGVDLFTLADEVPGVREHPERTVLAAIGADLPGGRKGFVLLAGQSDPHRAAAQSTSEDLLDHGCNRDG